MSSNTYIMGESPAEMARLLNQQQLISTAMGGPLPIAIERSQMHDVLDLACGPGGWTTDMAFQAPPCQFVGLDSSRQMVAYATHLATLQCLSNVRFQCADITQPLPFPEHSFDLIYARFLSTFMLKDQWEPLVVECARVLRPGGVLILTEFERAISNAPAVERYSTMGSQIFQRLGRSFSPDGQHLGVLPMLKHFLLNAGFDRQKIAQQMFAVDFSFGEDAHDEWCTNLLATFRLSFQFYMQANALTAEELERLYQQIVLEMNMPAFRAIMPCMSVWGYRS